MNVNLYNTTDYENKTNWTLGENKPNSNPIKACPERIEFTLSVIEGNGPISKYHPKGLPCLPSEASAKVGAAPKGRPDKPQTTA